MPGRDRTGPMGYGPMTGGGRGYCAGNQPGDWGGCAGWGRGGGGRGWRHVYHATGLPRWARPTPVEAAPVAQEQISLLRARAQQLGAELADLDRRLQALGAAGADRPEPA